ncbi:TorF family putative porin [uncultured Psychrosphaera sp.]
MKNNMKKTLLATLLGATTLVSSVAHAELSANASVVSNYLWRGLEQADGGPAVQGGLDYSNESGFYAGTWASNVDFGGDAKIELDLYGGYTGSLNDKIEFDVGYVLFAYPGGEDGLNFGELYGNFSMDALTVGIAVLANATGADFGDSLYLSADYAIPLSNDFELGLHIGSYSGDFSSDTIDIGATIAKDSWAVGVSKVDEGDDEIKLYASYAWDFAL